MVAPRYQADRAIGRCMQPFPGDITYIRIYIYTTQVTVYRVHATLGFCARIYRVLLVSVTPRNASLSSPSSFVLFLLATVQAYFLVIFGKYAARR